MKKYISNFMMMAVMAVVAISFTACGGDDSDDPLVDNGKESSKTYMEPCLDWGCDVSHIKTYMGNSMSLTQEESYGTSVLAYTTSDYKYVITYLFAYKLFQVYVYYYDKNRDYFTKLISQYETRYQTKFEKLNDENYETYGTNCTINGKYCGVGMQFDAKTNTIFVMFGLADK